MDSTIGQYRIDAEIGRGGMGVVYRATDTRLDRSVAIKALPEHLAADPDRLARFEREAKLLAQLNHPNVASIHGVEEQGGSRYLVLEFVEGETLAERLDRGNLAWDEAQEIAIQIASGVQAAHIAGVIHRDLKPANIKITPEGKVKVLDFGLARVDDTGASSSSVSQMPTLTSPVQHSPTMAGVIMGTAAYMSPEQARGRSIDKRTDIWSFGVVLYECLTGASPFVGETATDSIGAILHKELDYALLPKNTPPLALHTLKRCLQRSRDRRYHDFGDLILDLQDANETETTSQLSPGPWRTLSLTCFAIAAIALGALAWTLSRAPSTDLQVVHTSIQAPEGMKIEDYELSADGQIIGVICERLTDGRSARNPIDELYVRRLSDQAWTKVPQSEGTYTFWFSPDNTTLAFVTRGEDMSAPPTLMRTDALATTTPVEILRVPPEYTREESSRFCWTPQNELVFYNESKEVLVLHDPGTGNAIREIPITLTSETIDLNGFTGPFGSQYVKMSSSGYTTDGYQNDIVLIDLMSGEAKIVIENARSLNMLENGRVAFARGDSVFVSEFDPNALELVGAFSAVHSGLATGALWNSGYFHLSKGGTICFIPGGVQGNQRSIVFEETDGSITPWSDLKRSYEDWVVLSPDGTRLAVVITSPRGLYELWGSDVDRPRLRRLLAIPYTDIMSPVFTPESDAVVVITWNPRAENKASLMRVPYDNPDDATTLLEDPEGGLIGGPVSVSPIRSTILLESNEQGISRFRELSLSEVDTPTILLEGSDIEDARYAPGQTPLIAYTTTATGRGEVVVRARNQDSLGAPYPVTFDGAWGFFWAIDEQQGLGIRYYTYEFKEHFVPIAYENNQIVIGDEQPTGRTSRVEYNTATGLPDGRLIAILAGENEKPVTHLDLIQNWTQSLD